MKQLKDYLKYHIGCEVRYSSHHEPQNETYILTGKNLDEAIEFEDKPLLIPLSKMTTEQAIEVLEVKKEGLWREVEITGINEFAITFTARYASSKRRWNHYARFDKLSEPEVHYLLSNNFDFFRLIEAGIAIDKSVMK